MNHLALLSGPLGSLLTGKALKNFAALAPEITDNYDSLKSALLTGFSKTPETYREEFRSVRLGPNETNQQFAVQLGGLFDYWTDSRSVLRNYDNLREFIIVDQLLSTVPPLLRIHIKEQDKYLLGDVVRIADSWMATHRAYPKSNQRATAPPDSIKSASRPTGQASNSAPARQFQGNYQGSTGGLRNC